MWDNLTVHFSPVLSISIYKVPADYTATRSRKDVFDCYGCAP